MFDFGDHKIPWLIWIQILIIFLLIILLYFFSISLLDLPQTSSSSSTSGFADEQNLKKRRNNTTVFISTQHNQVRGTQSIKGELATSSRRIMRGEDIKEKEESSPSKSMEPNRISYHLCHYVSLAKSALLKCLGLDLLFDDYPPSNTEQ